MKQREFPKYRKHEDVLCFNCKRSLAGVVQVVQDFAAGKYRKLCKPCSLLTWYDIA